MVWTKDTEILSFNNNPAGEIVTKSAAAPDVEWSASTELRVVDDDTLVENPLDVTVSAGEAAVSGDEAAVSTNEEPVSGSEAAVSGNEAAVSANEAAVVAVSRAVNRRANLPKGANFEVESVESYIPSFYPGKWMSCHAKLFAFTPL